MSEPDITPRPHQDQTLLRRNSVSASSLIPTKLILPSPYTNGTVSPQPLHFELLSLKPTLSSYTSLKDLLPSSALNSPSSAASSYEISIRNRLVKQAAWAYLQPMSSSHESSGHPFFRRMWLRFCSDNPVVGCLRFISLHIISSISGVFERLLRVIRVRTSR